VVRIDSATRRWVLVVEDEALAGRSLARRIERRASVAVRLAATVEAAGEQLTAGDRPVAMVLDGRLSRGQHGADALRFARRAGCTSPCAFWTSCGEAEIVHELERRGCEERPPVFDKLDVPGLLEWLDGQLAAYEES